MRVSFIDTVHPILSERLSNAGFECIDHTALGREAITSELTSVDGIVVRSRFRMNASLLDHAPQLKFIARSGAGIENIDLDYCQRRNITCFNAPEGNRNAVAEHALGMLLMLFNKLHTADREVRQGTWDREGNRGIELDGKTVGIIGYGNNGSAFARKLMGFDVRVLAYDKYKQGFSNDQVEECTIDYLQQESDVISLHIPFTEETSFMVDEGFINACRKPFYLINLSRGKIVSTTNLLEGLNSGEILGACLDVLEYESSSFENWLQGNTVPPDLDQLLKHPNVVLSPHVGGWTHESYFKLSDVLADKILNQFG